MDFGPQLINRSNKCQRKKRSVNSLLKVVYISSPMKVKTSASRFRTLVQELTGRDSDISRYMDANTTTTANRESHLQDFEILPETKRVSKSMTDNHQQRLNSSSFCFVDPHQDSSPTSSDSFLEQEQPPTFDDAFINGNYFQGLISSDLFTDSSELDILGSYDAL